MDYIRLSYKDIRKHLIIWCLITAYLCFIDPVPGSFIAQIVGTFLIMFKYMFVYYISYLFIFPNFLGKSIIKLFSLLIISCLAFILIEYFNFYWVIPKLGGWTHFDNTPLHSLAIRSLFLFPIVLVAALENPTKLSIKIPSKLST